MRVVTHHSEPGLYIELTTREVIGSIDGIQPIARVGPFFMISDVDFEFLRAGGIDLVAPTATGTIADQDLTYNGDPVQIVGSLGTIFDGFSVTFSVSGYPGASIVGSSLQVDPTSEVVNQTVTVTATNPEGSADISFGLTVEALEFTTASISGSNIVGELLTVTAATNRPGADITYIYKRDGSAFGAIDKNTYRTSASDDGRDLTCLIRATLDGVTIETETPAISIQRQAPIADNGLNDLNLTTGSGDQVIQTAGDFIGEALVFSVSTSIPGVTIDSQTGEVTIPTGSDVSGTITIIATNTGGSAQSQFSVTISTAATAPSEMAAPTVTALDSESVRVELAAAPADGGATITQYDLRWSDDESSWVVVQDISDPYTIPNLNPSTVYYVQTAAVNSEGRAPWSDYGMVTTEDAPPADVWNITDNGDGTFNIISAPPAPPALILTDNGDGTFDMEAA